VNNFFGEGSPYLHHPLLTTERTERELDEIATLVGALDVDVLDVGCGFGRHAVGLAARGARVTAIDPSGAMIDAARAAADAAGQSIHVEQADAVGLDALECFDLAISLFTSFGQLSSADGGGRSVHADALAAVYGALRPGGRFLVELPDRPRAVAALKATEQLGPTLATRRFDEATSVISEQFVTETGATFDLFYEVFSADELVALVEGAGFMVESLRDRGLVEPPMTMMTLLARRPPEH
jgi:SAM-dependent methyltransferase